LIVLDASAAIEVLIQSAAAPAIEQRLMAAGGDLHAPHLIDLEVVQVLRRLTLNGADPVKTRAELAVWIGMPVKRYPHVGLLDRIWELRTGFSAYDAVYIALAEALSAPLVTHDAKLAAPGHRALVEVV
jgi:predicted nucleic acid-binding protein